MTHSPRSRRPAVVLAAAVLLLAGCEEAPRLPVLAKDDARQVDWKAEAYRVAGCTTRAEWVADALPGEVWDAETVQTSSADVTGDGADEVLVQVTCPAATSTRAERVAVFAVTGPAPELLGVLGGDLFHPQADVRTDGTSVTLSGATVAGDDPYCCPGHWGTVTYSWDGARFVVRSQHEVPGTAPTWPHPASDAPTFLPPQL